MRKLLALLVVALLIVAGCGGSDSPAGPTTEVNLEVTPTEGTVLTDFAFQATGSTSGTGTLEYRWDWDGDSTWDTDWSTDTDASHRFAEGGTITIRVQVDDGSRTAVDSVAVVIDGRHGYMEDMFDLPFNSLGTGLAYDGAHFWVTNWGGPTYKLDAATGDSLGNIPRNSPWTGGITWDGANLWTVGYSVGMKVFKQDPMNGTILDSFSITYSHGAAGLDWDGSVFYCGSSVGTSGGDGRIHIHSADGTEVSSFPSPRESEDPRGVAFDGVNAWVKIAESDSFYVVDPDDGEVLRVIYAPNAAGPVKIADGHVVLVLAGPPTSLARMVP